MTDTPRTDEFASVESDPNETWAIAADWADFARTLERDLTACRAALRELRELRE